DATTAQLTPIGHAPAEAVPRAFGLDPGGNFLYAAGLDTGVMTSYRIDGDTGELEPLETYHVGKAPMWVLMVRTGE
ncbi:MAG: beta-propeller fold lactonase family protein, partial [SAR202 cluster bacterium]|nr:beta-propeller fold lactonase family protein [SAR202 cluster bacterium]